MSTIQRLQLDRQAHDACALLAQAQYQLLVIRERQLAEASREAQAFHEDILQVEKNAEDTWDRIEKICTAHGLGNHGSPLEKLDRISALLQLRHERIEELDNVANECHGEIAYLRKSCAERDARITAHASENAELRVALAKHGVAK